MSYKINIVIEEDSDGFYAYCPQLEGCQSQGDSLEEVKQNIHEAVELYRNFIRCRKAIAFLKIFRRNTFCFILLTFINKNYEKI